MNRTGHYVVREMNPSLVGSWISHQSGIPNFISGREWVHFSPNGNHCLEALQPGQDIRRAKFNFTLREESGSYHFQLSKALPDGTAQKEYPMDIVKLNDDEISLTPDLPRHGFTTVYRRVEAQEESPIQSP